MRRFSYRITLRPGFFSGVASSYAFVMAMSMAGVHSSQPPHERLLSFFALFIVLWLALRLILTFVDGRRLRDRLPVNVERRDDRPGGLS